MGAGITILEEASMTTVTRADLTEAAAVKGAVEKEEARDRVDQCLATISDALVAGDRVGINGFGSFEVRQKPAQVDRNPKHLDEEFVIPARRVVKFSSKPGGVEGGGQQRSPRRLRTPIAPQFMSDRLSGAGYSSPAATTRRSLCAWRLDLSGWPDPGEVERSIAATMATIETHETAFAGHRPAGSEIDLHRAREGRGLYVLRIILSEITAYAIRPCAGHCALRGCVVRVDRARFGKSNRRQNLNGDRSYGL